MAGHAVTPAPLACPDCLGLAERAPDGAYDVWHAESCPARRDAGASAERWLTEQLAAREWLPDYAVSGSVVPARHHLAGAA